MDLPGEFTDGAGDMFGVVRVEHVRCHGFRVAMSVPNDLLDEATAHGGEFRLERADGTREFRIQRGDRSRQLLPLFRHVRPEVRHFQARGDEFLTYLT